MQALWCDMWQALANIMHKYLFVRSVLLTAFVLFFLSVSSPQTVDAATVDEMRAQVVVLQEQVRILQAQLAIILGVAASQCRTEGVVCGTRGFSCPRFAGGVPPVCPIQPPPHTYSSICALEREGARFLHTGACVDPATLPEPIFTSFTGPISLARGVAGRWEIQGWAADCASIRYGVDWGDTEQYAPREEFGTAIPGSPAVVTHTYHTTGTRFIIITLYDINGRTISHTHRVAVY
mgnify:FL=1